MSFSSELILPLANKAGRVLISQDIVISRLAGRLTPGGGRGPFSLLRRGKPLRHCPPEFLHLRAQGLTRKRGLRLKADETREFLRIKGPKIKGHERFSLTPTDEIK